MAKFDTECGGFMLVSPKGKRFKEAQFPFATEAAAREAAKMVAKRIAQEGRRDPVYVVEATAFVKAEGVTVTPIYNR